VKLTKIIYFYYFDVKPVNTRTPALTKHKRLNTWSQSRSNLYQLNVSGTGLNTNIEKSKGVGGTTPTRQRAVSSTQENRKSGTILAAPVGGVQRQKSRSVSVLHDRPDLDAGIQGDGKEVYFPGIIDILVQFGLYKRGEYLFKGYIQGHGQKVSVIPPQDYGKRFLEFCKTMVE